jgi:DNA repair photolyase
MSAKRETARGRGAQSNASGRFEPLAREGFDDGWGEPDEEPVRLETTVTAETGRTVITRNTSPDIGFDRSINPYRGCEHGCIYCYARPSHAYVGLSPGLDFETKLFFKADAARLLEKELSKPGYQPRPIHIGANTDPYQPIERELKVTRSVLEVLQRFRHPFTIISKSALIVRDLDILGEMGQAGLCKATVSITSLDRRLARDLEPRASTPSRRLEALGALAAAGVPSVVSFSPVILGLNDSELEAVLAAAARLGAVGATYVMLRLPLEIRALFEEWLSVHRPDRAKRIMSLVRQMRGGRAYDAAFGLRMTGQGPWAELIAQRFGRACEKHGLNRGAEALDVTQFQVPAQPKPQLDLFG